MDLNSKGSHGREQREQDQVSCGSYEAKYPNFSKGLVDVEDTAVHPRQNSRLERLRAALAGDENPVSLDECQL